MEIDRDKFIVNSIDCKARIYFNDANERSICKDHYYTDFISRWTKEKLVREAKRIFGVTSNPIKGFWLLDDGSLLNGEDNKGNIQRSHDTISLVYKDDPISDLFLSRVRHIFFIWLTGSIKCVCKQYQEGTNNNKYGLCLDIWCNIDITKAQWSRMRSIVDILGSRTKIFYDCKLQNKKTNHYGRTYNFNEVKAEYSKLRNL